MKKKKFFFTILKCWLDHKEHQYFFPEFLNASSLQNRGSKFALQPPPTFYFLRRAELTRCVIRLTDAKKMSDDSNSCDLSLSCSFSSFDGHNSIYEAH